MTTLAEAIDAALDAGWTAAGGTEPTISNTQDVLTDYFPATDCIVVLGWSLMTRAKAANNVYNNKRHTIELLVSTCNATTTEDRLNEIITEIERILNAASSLTGYTDVNVIEIDRGRTNKERHVYQALVKVEAFQYLV